MRVHWRERQRLSAADLIAEQDYRLNGLGRHFLAPHGWGIIRGLWLSPLNTNGQSWRLSPGIAVDGYGREIVVREPIDFDVPAGSRLDHFHVFLHYCETPASNPPCAPCADLPLSRTHQFVQFVLSQSPATLSANAVNLGQARAAGRLPDLVRWPVLAGVIGAGEPKAIYDETRYHAQQASVLKSPSGGVALRQGLLGPDDQYQLLLTTDAIQRVPQKRLAVDRTGAVHVWKSLYIAGAKASARIALAGQAALLIEADMPIGPGRRVILSGTLEDVASPRLTLDWQDDRGRRDRVQSALLVGNKSFLDKEFNFLAQHSVRLNLVQGAKRTQAVRNVKVSRASAIDGTPVSEVVPSLAFQKVEVELTRSGGTLSLRTRALPQTADVPARCDNDSRVATADASTGEAGGTVLFRAAKQETPGPTARAIQAVSEPKPDGTPTSQLRLSGGEFDEGDHGARVAIGALKKPASAFVWRPLLTLDGGGRVRMPEDGTELRVAHRLQLPPITTNPADPLSQDLLGLAYNAGIRRAGKIQGGVTCVFAFPQTTPSTPAPDVYTVKRGETLQYTVTITSATAGRVKRAYELVVGQFSAGDSRENRDVALRVLPGVTGLFTHPAYAVTIPAFQHEAEHVVIALELLVEVAGKELACSAVSGPIKVMD